MSKNKTDIFYLTLDNYKIPVKLQTVKSFILNEIAELSVKTGMPGNKLPVDFVDTNSDTIAFFGYCRDETNTHFSDMRFNFSLSNMEGFSARQIADTVRHEFAHYVRLLRYGYSKNCHDAVWKKICVELGATPEEYHKPHITRCIFC